MSLGYAGEDREWSGYNHIMANPDDIRYFSDQDSSPFPGMVQGHFSFWIQNSFKAVIIISR